LLAVGSVPPWPAQNGVSLRASNFLEHLAEKWDISLFTAEEGASSSPPPGRIAWTRVPGVPIGDMLALREERKDLTAAVRTALATHTYDVGLVWYGAEFIVSEVAGFPPALADRIDCGALQAWRDASKERDLRQKLRSVRRAADLLAYERRAFRDFQTVVATGDDDARVLRRISGHPRVISVPNGVALPDTFSVDEAELPTVVFTGVLAYPPNIAAIRFFAREVWPQVHREVSGSRFVIAGRSPTDEVRELAIGPGIELHADVPDMTSELRRSWLAVAPMRSGSGIKNKVLEAWAAARPTVLTSLATNGLELDAVAGELIADEPRAMRELVIGLLTDRDRRVRFGLAGRRLVEERHSWRVVSNRLDRALDDVAFGAAK